MYIASIYVFNERIRELTSGDDSSVVERRASDRKVADPWFDSRIGSTLLCPWERSLRLLNKYYYFPFESNCLSVVWPRLTKNLQTEPKKVLWVGGIRQTHGAWFIRTNEQTYEILFWDTGSTNWTYYLLVQNVRSVDHPSVKLAFYYKLDCQCQHSKYIVASLNYAHQSKQNLLNCEYRSDFSFLVVLSWESICLIASKTWKGFMKGVMRSYHP